GRVAGAGHAGLLVREGQDDGVEPDDAILFTGDVEVVSLYLFGRLFEGDDDLELGHLAERVGALVESVAARDHLAVADRRAFRAVHANVGGALAHQTHQEIDSVNLDRDGRSHRSHYTTVPATLRGGGAALQRVRCRAPRAAARSPGT